MFNIHDRVKQKKHRYPYMGLTGTEVGTVVDITNVTGTSVLIDVHFPGAVDTWAFYTHELEAVHDEV